MQIPPLLSVGKIQNHVLCFLYGQKSKPETLCAQPPPSLTCQRRAFPHGEALPWSTRTGQRRGERLPSQPAPRVWSRQLLPFFTRAALQGWLLHPRCRAEMLGKSPVCLHNGSAMSFRCEGPSQPDPSGPSSGMRHHLYVSKHLCDRINIQGKTST